MHTHQLLDHPLFEERPIKEVLEPFGFQVNIESHEPPIDPDADDDMSIDVYASDPQAYIDAINFQHPPGFTEVYRAEDESGDIISVAVRAKTVFAQLLLCADSAFAGPNSSLSAPYLAVYRERQRQLVTEGFSRERDDSYLFGELAYAAASYAHHAAGARATQSAPAIWPWDRKWWKPSDRRRDLVKAGALILAEIERLDRAAERQGGEA